MKKISLSLLAVLFSFIQAFSQTTGNEANTTVNPNYEDRKLKIEEINLVGSYYHQDGNNSAVTGGIGSELLTDFSNSLDLRLSKKDKKARVHSFGFEMGFDTYTSASSDMIDPTTITSQSYEDQRYYPSIFWSINNPKKGRTFGANASYSQEWDYKSYGGGLNFTQSFNENNTELSLKANAFFDKWWIILPDELRPEGYPSGTERRFAELPVKPRNSFNFSASLSQIVNERLQVSIIAEPNFQKGQLATPYQRVYFNTTSDDSLRIEKLPSERWKLPIGVRANYFIGDNVIARAFYRYYFDQWGLKAHTLELEAPIKINPFLSITPNYRYYRQNGISSFAPYKQHVTTSEFYTSDYDLSKLQSHSFGAGIRWKPLNGVFGMKHWSKVELRYLHYQRSTALSSNIVSLLMSFK
jgi:Protein of unknown function (DUF3570)